MSLNVIDLFCGCGGLSEGFRLAGFNIIGGVDFNNAAIKTFNVIRQIRRCLLRQIKTGLTEHLTMV